MRKILKQIFTAVISFALTLITVVAGIFPATIFVTAEEGITYEQTDALDDLKGSIVNGKEFSLTEYAFDESKDTQVLSFVEYCYSFYENLQDNYGLHVYVYNPKGLVFTVDHPLNQIQFAYGLSTSQNYTKYQLAFLNYSTEAAYKGLFYKFKVVMTEAQKQTLLQGLNSSERVYRVSGIELLEQGKTNATEYSVETTYRYSGYAAGYGSDSSAGNTLACNSEQAEALTLNVYSTAYRPSGTNGKNNYTQDSLHSVYFAVPNAVIKKYGGMSAIHATWKNAVLKPSLVTGNETAYDKILPYLGQVISKDEDSLVNYDSVLNYMYLGAYIKKTGALNTETFTYDYSFNCDTDHFMNTASQTGNRVVEGIGENINPLYMLFYAGSGTDSADNYTVSSEDILLKLKESVAKYGGELVNGKYSEKVFSHVDENYTEVNIKADEEYSLTSEKIAQSWWEKIFGLSHVETSTTFNGIQAIYPVKESDLSGTAEEVAKRLYISQGDYAKFKEYYEANKELCTIYLFRYQTSDYVAQEASLLVQEKDWLGDEVWNKKDTNAYFFYQTVNLDFDIIDVTFSNGETDTVIPVVSNPIDVVPDATPPVYTESDVLNEWMKWIRLAVICIVAIVLIIVFWQFVGPFFKAIWWIICLPFKAIGLLFKKKKDKESEEKKNDESGK